MLTDLKSQTFSNADNLFNQNNSKQSTEVNLNNMTLQERLNISDYFKRIEFLKNRQIKAETKSSNLQPYFMGMPSG